MLVTLENGEKSYIKMYEDRNYLANEFLTLGHTAKQIANNHNISYRLVNTWLIKHGLIARTENVKTV